MKALLLTALLASVLVIESCFWDAIPEPHSLKYHESSFNSLASDIVAQNQIYEMDDFTRHTKKVNGIFIRLHNQQNEDHFIPTRNIDSVMSLLKIDRKLLNDFRERLEKTKLRQFYKSNDSVLFVVDGFLDHSWGYFYCKSGLNNDTTYFNFLGQTVRFVDTVNKNWKKVSIH